MPLENTTENPENTARNGVLRDVLIPESLLASPENFKGRREGDCLRGDVTFERGRVIGMVASVPTDRPVMLAPGLVEAHCHLDKCHTVHRLGAVGGDLAAALDAQRRDKSNWTSEDLRDRMTRGLAELEAAGCVAVRSHIDWGDTAEPPPAWRVLQNAVQRHSAMTVQAAALIGIAQLAGRNFCDNAARHISRTPDGVLGTFVLNHDQADIRAGLENAFRAAERYGLALDFHVDEGLGDHNGLEIICDAARDARFEGPILCGHAVSLIDKSGADLDRIIDKLLQANVSVCALPTTNLYLQGRRQGTPDRRGLTRLLELARASVPVIVASDNVGDAFCPMGQHDPRAALHLAALAAHLDPPMGRWLPAITLNAARAMGLDPPFVDRVPLDKLRLCAAASTCDLIGGGAPLRPLKNITEKEVFS